MIGTALMGNPVGGAPFVLAGAIKCVYDLSLWRLFSRVPLESTLGAP